MENKKQIKLTILVATLAAFVITIIHNIDMDIYVRSIIVPFIVMVGSYVILTHQLDMVKNKKAYWFLIPIVLILLSGIVIKIDLSNMFLNIIVLPLLISMFFFSLTNTHYEISDQVINFFFKLFPSGLFSNLKCIKTIGNEKNDSKKKTIFNIFIGILISIPIIAILLSLLATADKYFSFFVGKISDNIFATFNFGNIISNLFVIVISFITLFSIFVNLFKNTDTKGNEKVYHNVNSTIVSTILVLVNFVFTLFLVSEISKLTNNFLQLPIEYTYAEYAREGFFQLLFITAVNFGIILYFVYCTKVIETKKIIKYLLTILTCFSIMLIFNSYYRMFLYVNAYTFTILRLQVLLFLTMELFIFVILLKKILYGIGKKDARLYTIIMIITYVLNVYLCSDIFVKLLNNCF